MSRGKVAAGLIVAGLVATFAAGMAFAQPGVTVTLADTNDPVVRARMAEEKKLWEDRERKTLGVTNDDEWKVLWPKIEKVEIMSDAISHCFWPQPPAGDQTETATPITDLQAKVRALQEAAKNKDADPKDLAQKLAAVREARDRAKAELKKARAALKELLTARQEAALLLHHTLD